MAKKVAKKLPKCADYHEALLLRLKDHDYAAAYLNAALKESLKGDAESRELFLSALKNVAEAQGSMSNLAKRVRMSQECLYKMLSKQGKPELSSFAAVLHAMGFGFSIR
jgi:probable addiction module antidote protein